MNKSNLPQGKKARKSTWGELRIVCGAICLVKERIDPETHTLRCHDAYAVDAQKFERLRSEGGQAVIVRQVDRRVFCASVATFEKYGILWETERDGLQIALPLRFWKEVNDPHFGEAA